MYFIYNIIVGNTFDHENFKLLITKTIKEREEFILSKNWMEIATDPRIVKALISSSMLSSKFWTKI